MTITMTKPRAITKATDSSTLGDLLERILDKGVVIAGDIKVNLVEVELLTIQIRLLVCSVDKAKELGIDWWSGSSFLTNGHGRARGAVEGQEKGDAASNRQS